MCIIELFAGSYRNIYCRYIKKAGKNLEVRVKVLTFAHAFRERGAVMEKRGIFLENKNETLRFAVRFRVKKASDP